MGREFIFSTMVVTVLIGVFAHGLTAFPGANWYANSISSKENIQDQMPEMLLTEDMPVRLPW